MVENENKKNKKFFIIGGVVLLIVIVAVILIMVFLPKKKKEVSYNILFDSDGGTTVQEQSLKKGEKVKTPDFPEKDGYVFEYWMFDGKEYDFNSEVSSDIKLKAKWKVVVSFDSDGGTCFKIDGGCGNNTLSNETPGSGTVYSKWSLKKAI